MLLEESIAPILAGQPLLLCKHLLQEWQLLYSDGFEARQIQLPDLLAAHTKDFPEHSVAHVGGVISRGHQLPELEFYQVVHLILGEKLHARLSFDIVLD